MTDVKFGASGYAGTGVPDTATSIIAGTDEIKASYLNFPVGAIIGIQGILGNALTLKGTHTDLVARLAIALDPDGKLKDVSATTKTVFPGVVSEGMLGVTSLTASEVIRMHASLDQVESAGVTIPVGGSGEVCLVTDSQTLTNKTLTTPTITIPVIADFTNATHNHSDAASGGTTVRGGAGFDSTYVNADLDQTADDSTASVTLTTTTGGLVIFAASGFVSECTPGSGATIQALLRRDGTTVSSARLGAENNITVNQNFSIVGADGPTAGAHTYTVSFLGSNNSSTLTVLDIRLFVFSAQ